MKKISLVVPVYNEEDNIEHFTAKVKEVMSAQKYDYELIFVDDGSKDRSREILRRLEQDDKRVCSIFLAKNSGHQLALTCGMDYAEGDAVITMDGDMQHPPELLPELIARWEKGAQVVQTIRETTEGVSLFKRLTSKYYYRLMNFLAEVPIRAGGSDFRLMDRQVVLEFRRYREHARFIRGIVGSMGYRQELFTFVAPQRFAGTSKFSLRKMLNFAVDGILAYSRVPLRISLYAGFLLGFASILYFINVIYERYSGQTVEGWATIVGMMLLFGGIQLVFLGIMGEYIGRIFEEVKARPLYSVARLSPTLTPRNKQEDGNVLYG
ncbi:MAG: glycosyltransferase family 2 protein [Selenomonadaceae bacterium]|nr:glycosyltransferase family 2 protein [Selenomonadaceae bacterium]